MTEREMKEEDMDRILSQRDEIVPSSGFTASVMEAVRREAAAPPPIPFPWKRALPGVVLAAAMLLLILVFGIVVVVESAKSPAAFGAAQAGAYSISSYMPHVAIGNSAGSGGAAGWALLALGLTFVSVTVSMRLAKT